MEKKENKNKNGCVFQPGHKKVGGRKKGTKNKMTTNLRKLVEEQITPHLQKLGEYLNKMDNEKRVAALAQYLNYLIPKYSNTTINTDDKRDISTEEYLRDLNGNYPKKDIHIDLSNLTIVNNH